MTVIEITKTINLEQPKYQNEQWLREQYLSLNRKVVDIAKECVCNRKTINYWLRKFKIPIKKPNTWNRGIKYNQIANERNPNWKGDKAGYFVIHVWVRNHKPKPEECEFCHEKKDYLELANISGEYKRDINDYKYLCVKCHKTMDNTLNPFIEGGKKTRFKKGHKNEMRWGK